ncbi:MULTISPECIES: imidazole glycerol phosphate synthase subunit HisH [unclassified Rhodococcus (in: high G+C Gram-positive bacteria)]|uniref:imidazole glycerol phosphate synthase subunit HisH n=1 Tax=unclassified Rhodococcus (in: high G+C Gram-positive bacteria) TaxID=192944 RepID=UPI001C9B2039|nr:MULTISPECIES: imidazole glycerol phosphate synthase subunit HisH [unclassified Rhodococcus (in: high G+C Gram-positive bacteria)]
MGGKAGGRPGRAGKSVALLDYGSGNLHSAQRALERVGADVTVTSDHRVALQADGLVVPGVGAFGACMDGLLSVRGDELVDKRLAGGRPVLGICVGMQIMFDRGVEFDVPATGCGQWPGTVEKLHAEVLPHMGWNTVRHGEDSVLFAGMDPDTRFYFVHSYGVQDWEMAPSESLAAPVLTWADHGGEFLAAVENGPLSATQFHPEKSGDAGATLLENWLRTLG